MKTDFYIEVRVQQNIMAVMSQLMFILHGIGDKHDFKYALAWPGMKTGERPRVGSILQVFSDTDSLECIMTELRGCRVKDYITITDIKNVGEVTEYVSYALVRTTSRKTKIEGIRQRQLERGKNLPYFQTHSRSNGHAYQIRVDPRRWDGDTCVDVEPNSYGLSVSTRAFAVPVV